jgi:hypothetical protein
MKAKINEYGQLLLQRNGFGEDYIKQFCHINSDDIVCSDFCPLFGEPKQVNVMIGTRPVTQIRLDLCHKILILESIDIEKQVIDKLGDD